MNTKIDIDNLREGNNIFLKIGGIGKELLIITEASLFHTRGFQDQYNFELSDKGKEFGKMVHELIQNQ